MLLYKSVANSQMAYIGSSSMSKALNLRLNISNLLTLKRSSNGDYKIL